MKDYRLKGKTSSTVAIKKNKDLALWRDITQTTTNSYPNELYDKVRVFLNELEYGGKIKSGDTALIKLRYGEGYTYSQITKMVKSGEGVRLKYLRILRVLSKNRHVFSGLDILTTENNKSNKSNKCKVSSAAVDDLRIFDNMLKAHIDFYGDAEKTLDVVLDTDKIASLHESLSMVLEEIKGE